MCVFHDPNNDGVPHKLLAKRHHRWNDLVGKRRQDQKENTTASEKSKVSMAKTTEEAGDGHSSGKQNIGRARTGPPREEAWANAWLNECKLQTW